jgi:hypothetical protein
MASNPQKVSSGKLWSLVIVSGVVDLIQIILDFTGIGIAVSEAIEAAMPLVICGMCWKFNIPIFSNPKRLASIFGAVGLDAITGGLAPFWILDAWYIKHDVEKDQKKMVAMAAAEQMTSQMNVRNPLNTNGVRQPQIEEQSVQNRLATAPRYSGGIGRPAGK